MTASRVKNPAMSLALTPVLLSGGFFYRTLKLKKSAKQWTIRRKTVKSLHLTKMFTVFGVSNVLYFVVSLSDNRMFGLRMSVVVQMMYC
jgi:hypothetical protein